MDKDISKDEKKPLSPFDMDYLDPDFKIDNLEQDVNLKPNIDERLLNETFSDNPNEDVIYDEYEVIPESESVNNDMANSADNSLTESSDDSLENESIEELGTIEYPKDSPNDEVEKNVSFEQNIENLSGEDVEHNIESTPNNDDKALANLAKILNFSDESEVESHIADYEQHNQSNEDDSKEELKTGSERQTSYGFDKPNGFSFYSTEDLNLEKDKNDKPEKHAELDIKALKTTINQKIEEMIKKGMINNREDVITYLSENLGYKIEDVEDNFIVIKVDKISIRLDGEYFQQDFNPNDEFQSDKKAEKTKRQKNSKGKLDTDLPKWTRELTEEEYKQLRPEEQKSYATWYIQQGFHNKAPDLNIEDLEPGAKATLKPSQTQPWVGKLWEIVKNSGNSLYHSIDHKLNALKGENDSEDKDLEKEDTNSNRTESTNLDKDDVVEDKEFSDEKTMSPFQKNVSKFVKESVEQVNNVANIDDKERVIQEIKEKHRLVFNGLDGTLSDNTHNNKLVNERIKTLYSHLSNNLYEDMKKGDHKAMMLFDDIVEMQNTEIQHYMDTASNEIEKKLIEGFGKATLMRQQAERYRGVGDNKEELLSAVKNYTSFKNSQSEAIKEAIDTHNSSYNYLNQDEIVQTITRMSNFDEMEQNNVNEVLANNHVSNLLNVESMSSKDNSYELNSEDKEKEREKIADLVRSVIDNLLRVLGVDIKESSGMGMKS